MNDSPIRGRGTSSNPANRFERIEYVRDDEVGEPDDERPQTVFYRDDSRSIIATNESPDVTFDAGINPYRGCEHGCIYCYARAYHEYLGFSAGLDFETRILVKENAPTLLGEALAAPGWTPRPLGLSGGTDPYQPIERRLKLTRRCIEVLAEFRNPVIVITKNHLVTRDADLLAGLAGHDAAFVYVSVTTLDAELARVMEPRTSSPRKRLDAVAALRDAGVPVGVFVAPVIPGLTDHEIPSIMREAARAGATHAGYIMLRLPHGIGDLFEGWLADHFPDRRQKVLNRIESIRGGRRNDPNFGTRGRGTGAFARQIGDMFRLSCAREGLRREPPALSSDAFRRPPADQMSLFD